MQALTLNKQLIAYRYRQGGGPTVVFANSLGSDQSLWDSVIDNLGRGFNTLTYDLRGHGLSDLSELDYTVDDLADDLIALIEALKLENIILCGVSVGGMVAQSLAARRPDIVSGVILCNTAARIGDTKRWNERISVVEEQGISSIADAILDNWFAKSYKLEHPNAFAAHRNMLCRVPAAGYVATCRALRDSDLSDACASISVPALCIGGTADLSVPKEQVETLASSIPGAQLEILDNVGHLPALEAPRRMARIIEHVATSASSRFDAGMAIRRSVLGDAHVDKAEANKTTFDAAFQRLITESAWGTVWASHGISRRERSMLTLALLAAMGNFDEIPMHVRAASRTGTSALDIQEAFQHVAIYAGVPRANRALKIARETLVDMGHPDDE